MKTVVMVDAACDLPLSYLREHGVHLLPNALVSATGSLTDNRAADAILAFHRHLATAHDSEIQVKSCSANALAELFLNRLVLRYDRALLITMAQTRSTLFQNATEASFAILRGYRERRRQAGLETPFYLNVLDSRTLGAGQAILTDAAIRLLRGPELPFNELRRLIEEFRHAVRCYLLFNDGRYARAMTEGRAEPAGPSLSGGSLGALLGGKLAARFTDGQAQPLFKGHGFDRLLGRLLDEAQQEIDRGLRTPLVAISYAGDPDVLNRKRVVIDFKRHAQRWGVEVLVEMMSATGGLETGPGAVSLAFAVS